MGQIFLDLNLIDAFVEIDKAIGSWSEVNKKLEMKKYHHVISVHQSFRTAWIVARLKAENKLGYKKWWNFWAYQQGLLRNEEWPESLRQLALFSILDEDLKRKLHELGQKNTFQNAMTQIDLQANRSIPDWASCSIKQTVLAKDINLKSLNLPNDYVVIAPGSVWPTKRWTESGFIQLIQSLPLPIVLVGSPDEKDLCARIASSAEDIFNICGKTSLLETLYVMAHSRLTISNDSGAQHMSASVECPTLSLFGPTVLSFGYRPWYEKARVAEVDLPCRPCGKHGAKECPLGTHDCMKKLKVEEVMKLARQLL